MKSYLQRLILLGSFSFTIIFCHAQPGTLDSSFGMNGKVTTDFGEPEGTHGQACAVQADGKIVVAGYINQYSTTSDFAVARYLGSGNLDSTFGIDGKVVTHFNLGVSASNASSLVIQPDGKIIVGGWLFSSYGNPGYFALARYKINGTLDSTFGTNGKVLTNISNNSTEVELFSLTLQQDGKLIAGGNSDGFCVVRYKSNGNPDSTFGIDGKVEYRYILGGVEDLAVLKNGKILTLGYNPNLDENWDFQLIRLLTTGKIDSTFGNNGIVYTDFLGHTDEGFSLALFTNGDFVAAGNSDDVSTNGGTAIAKYHENGKIDSSFGSNGKVITQLDALGGFASKILVVNDDKLIITGPAYSGSFSVARFTLDGKLDSTFGIDGKAFPSFGGYSNSNSLALQNDGKIVLVGSSDIYSTSSAIALARFKGDEPITVNLQRNISVTEGSSGTTPAQFKVVLNRPSAYDVQVNYTTVNGNAVSGSDYVAALGKTVIRAGKTSKAIVVNVIGDNVKEKNEKFALVIGNPVNAQVGLNDTATCTITNDDPGLASSTSDAIVANTKTAGIKLYPNPVKDLVRIEGIDATVKTTITISDMKGNAVLRKSLSGGNTSLNVQQLAAGLYEVRIESAGKTQAVKFVKE